MTPRVDPFDVLCPDTSAIPRSEWLALRRQGIGSSDAAAHTLLPSLSSPISFTPSSTTARRSSSTVRASLTRRIFAMPRR